MIRKRNLSLVHPYLENRYKDIELGLYPRQHLWGLEEIEKDNSWNGRVVEIQKMKFPYLLEKSLNRLLFRQSPGVKAEIAAWRSAKSSDLIYSVCGPLALSRFYQKTKLVSWVFRKPQHSTNRVLNPYSAMNLSSHAAFFCLTPSAEKAFSKHAPSRFLPWCVDLDLFDGKPAAHPPERPFFLASGKTERDYDTLAKAARKVDAEVRVIGPVSARPNNLPPNVNWTNTSSDPPDQAIDYSTLREWYAQSTAVCIPLNGDTKDTSGYTNLLEAMAMAKPVLMTRSGCLHIDPESHGFGYLVAPKSPDDWAHKMNQILLDSEQTAALGVAGRKIAEKEFSIKRFNHDVIVFLREILVRMTSQWT